MHAFAIGRTGRGKSTETVFESSRCKLHREERQRTGHEASQLKVVMLTMKLRATSNAAVTMKAALDALDTRLLALLPADGTPVLNRVMRAMLSRELERQIPEGEYFAARDRLLAAKQIGRLRGQGGQLFLVKETIEPEPATSPTSAEAWAEAKLMAPLKTYLEGPFRTGLDLGDALCIVEDTSTIGPRRGQWARPDFVLVSAMRFRLLPGAQVDVHSFELKTESGGTVQAVYEALAQTRFTHFGHLVWHLPEGAKTEVRLAEITTHCEMHGIGLIRLFDPGVPERSEILVDPRRKDTLPAVIDGFLESRLSSMARKRLGAAVRMAA